MTCRVFLIHLPVFVVCVRDSKRTEEVTVRLGEFHFRWPSLSRRDHEVERIDIHEKFNPVRQSKFSSSRHDRKMTQINSVTKFNF